MGATEVDGGLWDVPRAGCNWKTELTGGEVVSDQLDHPGLRGSDFEDSTYVMRFWKIAVGGAERKSDAAVPHIASRDATRMVGFSCLECPEVNI